MKRYTLRTISACVEPEGDWVTYEDHLAALAKAVPEWVSMDDRTPDHDGRYPVVVSDPDDVGWVTDVWWRAEWRDGKWGSADPVEDGQPVMYWMDVPPLPQPPKPEGGE